MPLKSGQGNTKTKSLGLTGETFPRFLEAEMNCTLYARAALKDGQEDGNTK